jgi:hypothetical protein
MTQKTLSEEAQKYGEIVTWVLFSGKCDHMRADDVRECLKPIFGERAIKEFEERND